MTQKTEYKHPKNWFKNNLIANPTGSSIGNCSACLFRNNAPKFCENLACTYIDPDTDYIETVYWTAKHGTYANVLMWPELMKFLDKTPKQKIRDISNDIVIKAVLAKQSEKTI